MNKIYPCLWFNDQAEEAAQFYTQLFSKSKIGKSIRYGKSASKASGQKEGQVMTVEFELEGHKFLALNGGPMFQFTPATSFFVWCKTEEEINKLWQNLSRGGSVLMEIGKYPWAERYGWCQDKFGLSWQLMLGESPVKMCPAILFTNKLLGKAQEAIDFYTSQFKNSKIEVVHKDPASSAVLHSLFYLEGDPFVLMEGPGSPKHQITHAVSFFVNCKDQKEIDSYWGKLVEGGGHHEPCGWLKDKFDVSWQVVPENFGELTSGPHGEKVMAALMQMKKLDIAKLKAAAK